MYKYELIIGVPLEIDAGNVDQLATVTNEFTLTNNQITFDIKKNNATSANSGSIIVVNAPRELANLLTEQQGQRSIIEFKAGFTTDPELPEIFRGVVENATEDKQGVDYRLTLKLSDGGSNKREFVSKRTYPTGTPINTVLRDLIGDAGLARGPIYEIREELRAPLSISGNTYTNIVKIAEKYGMNFSTQSGTAYVVPSNAGTQAQIFRIAADTGMVGSPSLGSNPANLAGDGTVPKQGIVVTSILNGNLIPENFVQVISDKVTGLYKIEEIHHSGNYEGSVWFSKVTCKPTDFDFENYVLREPYRSGG
jgi:hypothetical protein